MHYRHKLFYVLIFCAGLLSCSTRKNTVFTRAYNGLTTHYNFYFNARERMRDGAANLANAHQDKYDRVLSVFKYGDLNKAKAVFADMDEAIKKASIAIQRHSIEVKGKHDNKITEHNRWIPQCWIVIGKAQFYKHDYWTAIETFQYTSSQYKEDPVARPEALLWLMKSYLELGKTTDAEYLIDYIRNDKKFPDEFKGEYNASVAEFHLIRNDIPRARIALKAAAATARKKDDRARYAFILGQLYQKDGYLDSAYTQYEKVIKMNPPFEMAFNARINRARSFDIKSGKADQVKHELTKMLKDEKNKEFRDQIYYALAGIERQEKNEPGAIEYLNKSVRASTTNNTQKALTYLELADIYLKHPEYVPAAAYYDSALTNLTQDHPDYIDIQEKRNSLDRLVRNIKIVAAEDSLQALSSLTEEERKSKIESIISGENDEKERLKKENEEKQRLEEQQVLEEKELKSQPRNFNTPSTAQGAWYFYNQSAISFGYNEFLKRWGTRKLEDDWRRSDKEIIAQEETEVESIDSLANRQESLNDSIAKLDDDARKAAYLKQIPNTPEQIKESNLRIAEALYNLGVIYKEQLNNLPESIRSFETLDKRFPENKYKQPSYYNLYRSYSALGDSVKADHYKNYLLTNYPEAEYSKLILNPDFFRDIQRKTEVLEVFYENTYNSYLNHQYDKVIERKATADELYPGNKLAPKFALLRALAIGKTRSIPDFQLALEDVVRSFPKDTVSVRAKEIMAFLKDRSEPLPNDTAVVQKEIANFIDSTVHFTFVPENPQYFLVIYKPNALNVADISRRLLGFNTVNFKDTDLQIKSGGIDFNFQYIMISPFANKKAAMDYYVAAMNQADLFTGLDPALVQYYVISPDNLSQLVRTKNFQAYTLFFQKNYLQ